MKRSCAATAQTRPAVAEFSPDVLVHDILTLAPAMAAELEGIPAATLIPHLYPDKRAGAAAIRARGADAANRGRAGGCGG